MHSKQKNSFSPFWGLAVVLFLFSLIVPNAWDSNEKSSELANNSTKTAKAKEQDGVQVVLPFSQTTDQAILSAFSDLETLKALGKTNELNPLTLQAKIAQAKPALDELSFEPIEFDPWDNTTLGRVTEPTLSLHVSPLIPPTAPLVSQDAVSKNPPDSDALSLLKQDLALEQSLAASSLALNGLLRSSKQVMNGIAQKVLAVYTTAEKKYETENKLVTIQPELRFPEPLVINTTSTNKPKVSVKVSSSKDRLASLPEYLVAARNEKKKPNPKPTTNLNVKPKTTNRVKKQPKPNHSRLMPTTLLAQLDSLKLSVYAGVWARETTATIVSYLKNNNTIGKEQTLKKLRDLTNQSYLLATQTDNTRLKTELLRVYYGLTQRLDCWGVIHETKVTQWDPTNSRIAAQLHLQKGVNNLQQLLAHSEHYAAWNLFLHLDELAELSKAEDGDLKKRRMVAIKVLRNLNSSQLTTAQRAFVRHKSIVTIKQTMNIWSYQPVDLTQVMAVLEWYNKTGSQVAASRIDKVRQTLATSPNPSYQRFAAVLKKHYRLTNMRLAIHEKFINRLIPEPAPTEQRVAEKILGRPVHGHSHTQANLQLSLLPSQTTWKMLLQANGVVSSDTVSRGGPAHIRSRGKTRYQIQKQFTVDHQGLKFSKAVGTAKANNQLVGINTSYDKIPVISSLVRSYVKDEYNTERFKTSNLVARRVAEKAKQRMDREAEAKFTQIESQIKNRAQGFLGQLGLDLDPVHMYTTKERVIGRFLVSSEGQLAAHTPRPRALSDSWVSVQMHESAINNAIGEFQLDGKKLTAPELFALIREKMGHRQSATPVELSARSKIKFAKHDGAMIRLANGQVRFTLNIKEVSQGRRKIKNFKVHAYYRPVTKGLRAQLVSAGNVEIEGRVSTGARLVLYGIFNKVFATERAIDLIRPELRNDPRMQDLMVTQIVLDDGWLGLAIGPKTKDRVARLTR